MSRPLRAERYAKGASPSLVDLIVSRLPFLTFSEAMEFYSSAVPRLKPTELALLGCNDRFFLLTALLNRADAIHPWLYDRSREVEADPDDHLDLWARGHYKSTIITFAGNIQDVLIDPEITIGIFACTRDIARPFLAQIKQELEGNEELKKTYADVLWKNPRSEAPSWSVDGGLTVKRSTNPKEATIEAHGLIDAMPTGRHFRKLCFDDIVTERHVTNPDQIRKATERVELADNLGVGDGTRKQMAGTRYCTPSDTRILMADWTHRPIKDVKIGDIIIGWEHGKGEKRYLRPARVVNTGSHTSQRIVKFTFSNGRTVRCTPDHKWWRGARGSGAEYQHLKQAAHSAQYDAGQVTTRWERIKAMRARRETDGIPKHSRGLSYIRELLVPAELGQSRDHGWLAGFFDGEGTMTKNKGHPSGCIMLVQTMHNPGVIEETRAVLKRLGFDWYESWVEPAPHRNMIHRRCCFHITGGWRERYRFLVTVRPTREQKIAASLEGHMKTDKLKVVASEEAGIADVFWLETETGNYVAEGFCSSNSFADSYGHLLEHGIVKPRLYPATDDGTLTGEPVFLSKETWQKKIKAQRTTISAQMLQNPTAGKENTFRTQWLRPYWVRPSMMNIYIMGDPSKGKSATSDRTALVVVGIDSTGNKYLLDGFCHRMPLSERWKRLQALHKRWSEAPGVQSLGVGYERYGQQTDDEYFEEQMKISGRRFEIIELNWTGQVGAQSKKNRVERLEPDFRLGSFFVPARVWHPGVEGDSNDATWTISEDNDEITYRAFPHLNKDERRVQQAGEKWRLLKPLLRKDEDGNLYDLVRVFFEEFRFFPFSPRDDFVDAMSRIYDMDPRPAVVFETLQVQDYQDA